MRNRLAHTLPLKEPLFLFHHHKRRVKSQLQTLAPRSQALKLGCLSLAVARANGLPLITTDSLMLAESLPLPPSALPLLHHHHYLLPTHPTHRLPFLLPRRHLVHRRPDTPS